MKLRLAIISMALAVTVTALPAAKAQVNVSAGVQIGSPGVQISSRADFYDPLTPYGTWVNFSTYGRCWRPTQIDTGWRPYSNGEWVWTDAGWYWQSDEPWSWACYHYGSWYYDTNYGWIWIPGTEWAPAWVTWRYSDAYVGWAPCGPGLTVLAPSFFMFADVHHFGDRHRGRDLIVNNTTIINRTKIVNKFPRQTVTVNGSRQTIVSNPGPGVDPIQRATGTKFTPKPIGEVTRQTSVPESIRRNETQRPAEREQRQMNQEPRRETVPATGNEQPRTYQEPQRPNAVTPPEKNPAESRESKREMPATTEPRRELPQTTEPKRELPPTGNEQPRNYREVPTPNAPSPERPSQVTPPARPPAAPPVERVLPPTGREPQRPAVVPPVQRPPVREGPPQGVPPGQERDKDKDRNLP